MADWYRAIRMRPSGAFPKLVFVGRVFVGEIRSEWNIVEHCLAEVVYFRRPQLRPKSYYIYITNKLLFTGS